MTHEHWWCPACALLVGNVAGALLRINAEGLPTEVEVETDDDGNYTNRIYVTRESGRYVITVEPCGMTPG